MLFFQVVLFCGYFYAHLSAKFLRPATQGILHILLVVGAVLLLPIMPDPSWKPTDSSNPTFRILMLLAANVGLPYFILSSTAPLIQSWFSQTFAGKSPYRLYALSNAGSLVALLSYPFLFEPALAVRAQSTFWTLGFCVFAVVCAFAALYFRRHQSTLKDASNNQLSDESSQESKPPGILKTLLWLILPAFASIMLLATTNHICQDVAVIPFLWVAPLSLYLITFIISFDSPRWYSRRWFSVVAIASILAISFMMVYKLQNRNLVVEVGIYLSTMFSICMLCHGELVRSKPASKWLTKFYLMSSAGGAIGGFVVAIICPAVFATFFEMNLAMLFGFVAATLMLLSTTWKSWSGYLTILKPASVVAAYFGLLLVINANLGQPRANLTESTRNFYGVLAVANYETDEPESDHRIMFHGRIMHGWQWTAQDRRREATTYYAPKSGVGITLANFQADRTRRVGVIGLGVGTVATYAKPNDYYRFYEINPDVYRLAQDHFTFLEDCESECDVKLGDARLLMEQESPQSFDVLVVDAFSGDAVPAHLLTVEAMSVYQKHVKQDGVIAFHITNRHIDLFPIVTALAKHANIDYRLVEGETDDGGTMVQSHWILVSNDAELPQQRRGGSRHD